jgi:hypothetical protein
MSLPAKEAGSLSREEILKATYKVPVKGSTISELRVVEIWEARCRALWEVITAEISKDKVVANSSAAETMCQRQHHKVVTIGPLHQLRVVETMEDQCKALQEVTML